MNKKIQSIREFISDNVNRTIFPHIDDMIEEDSSEIGEIINLISEYSKMVKNEALRRAAENHQPKFYVKDQYKGAKWRELKDGESYNPLETSLMTKTDKKSIINSLPDTEIK